MNILRIAVFAMVFIACATYVFGGLDIATLYDFTHANKMQYPTTMCTYVQVTPGDFCYQDGIRACNMLNSGHCYQQCERDVQNTCSSPIMLPTYSLPRGFENAFASEQQCVAYVGQMCGQMTMLPNQREQCEVRGRMRCSEIGRLKL